MNDRAQVFVSYSHKDKQVVDELMAHFAPLNWRFDLDITFFDDKYVEPGDQWKIEKERAINKADIALLLVSPDFLASDWIFDVELPKLLRRSEEDKTLIISIILRQSSWAHTPLAYIQAFPRDGKPLLELSQTARDNAWQQILQVVEAELHSLSIERGTPDRFRPADATPGPKDKDAQVNEAAPLALPEGGSPSFFISHAKEDGDFAENLKGQLKQIKLVGLIDIDLLEAGADWREEIDEAIIESRGLILILSPDAKNSEYVTYEWAFALGSGLRIVPLMLRDTAIHPRLEAFQYFDFTNRRARPWDRLFQLLLEIAKSPSNSRLQSSGRRMQPGP